MKSVSPLGIKTATAIRGRLLVSPMAPFYDVDQQRGEAASSNHARRYDPPSEREPWEPGSGGRSEGEGIFREQVYRALIRSLTFRKRGERITRDLGEINITARGTRERTNERASRDADVVGALAADLIGT